MERGLDKVLLASNKIVSAEFTLEAGLGLLQQWCYLLDSRGKRCGFVELHDLSYSAELGDKAGVLVLSDAQPGDTIKIQQLGIDYNDDSPSREISHAGDVEEWPEIIYSCHEGREETGWQKSSRYKFDVFYARRPISAQAGSPVTAIGTEGPLGEDDRGSDKHTFDFYNVMLVKVSQIVRIKAEKEDELDRLYAVHERIGLGLLHYKALRWAFAPGPERKGIMHR